MIEHPEKPLDLIEKPILASSNKGDLVFDPFCGTDTTIVAAKKLGRIGLGVERSRRWHQVAKKRLKGIP